MQNEKISWPGWETVRKIGMGSFGAVYEIQRDVYGDVEKAALKVVSIPQKASDIDEMYSNGYDDESITRAFQSHLKSIAAEYSLMRKMNGSANIVSCDDIRSVQHDDGIGWDIYIKMELLTPLTKSLPAEIPEELVLKIARDMCAALELCKRFDIVHRDIKPQNILLSDLGDYKLGDFGIAKTVGETVGGTKVGTYNYMAPEVYNNQPYGAGADICSLGLVLYWLLNERRIPFLPLPPERLTFGMEETARQRRFSGEPLPPPAHGSENLKKIVLKACAYDPAERYASAMEMLADLNALSGDPVAVAPPVPDPAPIPEPEPAPAPAAEATAKRKKRKLAPVIVSAVAAAMALVVGFFTIHIWTEATCEKSSQCTVCGKTGTRALGHRWSGATCTDRGSCSVCGKTGGVALGHNWEQASCTTSSRCSRCGEVNGAALGHKWQEATCSSPEMCLVCGEVRGSALEHEWTEASFDDPKTCVVCGETEGTALSYDSISVEEEVLNIRDIYKEIHKNRDAGKYKKVTPRSGVKVYYDSDGIIVYATVSRGISGLDDISNAYSRSYYFSQGKLVFAFYDGDDDHRLYFYHDKLIRWRYSPDGAETKNPINYDLVFDAEYMEMEQLALDEVESLR